MTADASLRPSAAGAAATHGTRWHAWHPWPGRSLGDTGAVLLAVAAALGAWRSWPVPLVPAVLVLAATLAWRRPWAVVLSVFLVSSALGAIAFDGAAPAPRAAFTGSVTLMSDPVSERGGVRAEARDVTGRRLDLHAGAGAASVLRPRLAGERVQVAGTVTPRAPDDDWLLRRHVVGSIRTTVLTLDDEGNVAARAANLFRRTLVRGAASLPDDEQALFTGFVFGDDRGERPAVIADFRAAGLSHLLAVSGENVAFVLVAVRPLLQRLGLRTRLVVAVGVLAFFAFATRLEPSVLRATAMAMIAVLASALGRPVSAVRTLALAVTVLVLLDPFLVAVVGFQLSVAASAGIIVLARPLSRRLPGPRPVAELLGVTLAAQVGVAPVLLTTFGSVPLVSLPANLVAVPAAGPVMVWGLTAGLVAGVVGGPVAALIQVPSHVLLWWVEAVARAAASAPLGDLAAAPAAAMTAAAGMLWVAAVIGARPGLAPLRRVMRCGAALIALLVLVWVRPTPTAAEVRLGPGAVLHVGGAGASVLVVDGTASTAQVLGGLRANGVRRLDVLVARSAGRSTRDVVDAVRERVPPALLLTAPGADAQPPTEVVPAVGDAYAAGDLEVEVTAVVPVLRVQVRRGGAGESGAAEHGVGSARGPPRPLAAARPRRGARAGLPPLRHHRSRSGDGHPEPHP